MSSTSQLERYRLLVPAHAAVADAQVLVELDVATHDHAASLVADDLIVWAAAHAIESTSAGAAVVGPLTSQRDGDLSRTYAVIPRGDGDDWLRTTVYGQRYLQRRAKLAMGRPRWVSS